MSVYTIPASGNCSCRFRDVDRTERARLEPSTHGHLAVPGVEPEHDLAWEGMGQFGQQVRVLDRHTTHDETVHTRGHVGAGRIDRPNAAAKLAGHSSRRHHAGHEFRLHGHSRLGAFEIDDVEATGTVGCKPTRHGNRIVAEHGLSVIIALQKPHAPAAAEIDGGPEFHGQCFLVQWSVDKPNDSAPSQTPAVMCGLKTVRSSSIPAAWLFSG